MSTGRLVWFFCGQGGGRLAFLIASCNVSCGWVHFQFHLQEKKLLWSGGRRSHGDTNVPRLSLPTWAMRPSLLPAIAVLVNDSAEPAVPYISRPLLHSRVAPIFPYPAEMDAQSPGRSLPSSSHLHALKLSVILLPLSEFKFVLAEISSLELEKSNLFCGKTNIFLEACDSVLTGVGLPFSLSSPNHGFFLY